MSAFVKMLLDKSRIFFLRNMILTFQVRTYQTWSVANCRVNHKQSFSERRSLCLSATGAQKLMDERWARAHPKITERERKFALIFALQMEPFSPFWDW